MAINIRCKKCKADMKLATKKCKCGATVPRKGKSYRVIVRANGQRICRTVTNLELAREIESKLKIDIVRNEHELIKKKAPLLSSVWKKYEPWAQEQKPKSARTDFYYYHKHIEPDFSSKRLDQISPFDIEKLMIKMKKSKSSRGTPYAPATIKHQIVLFSRLYSLASRWGMYNGPNPCKNVKKPKLNNQVTEHLSGEELHRLLEILKNWDNRMTASFISFLLFTGLRRGELFKLTWKDIDFDRHTIALRDPKGIKDQILPLSSKAEQILKNIPEEYDTPFIFYGKKGKQRTDFKGPWSRIKKASGLPATFRLHGLRHHFASSLVSAGVNLYTVSKLLTHKDIATTQRYAHLADQTLRDAVNLSDKLQNVSSPKIINLKDSSHG